MSNPPPKPSTTWLEVVLGAATADSGLIIKGDNASVEVSRRSRRRVETSDITDFSALSLLFVGRRPELLLEDRTQSIWPGKESALQVQKKNAKAIKK